MQNKEAIDRVKESLKNHYTSFSGIYESKKELLEYYTKFLNVFRDEPDKAYYEFFSLSEYMSSIKVVKSEVLKLLMITSIIEYLNSDKEFITFPQWVSKAEKYADSTQKTKTIKQLFSEYETEYGCSSKFRRFFQNYLSKEEKVELVTSIKYPPLQNNGVLNHIFPLLCFDNSECLLPSMSSCFLANYNKSACKLYTDEIELKRTVDEFAEFLYTYRSNFVHNAKLFSLSQSKVHSQGAIMSLGLWTYAKYNFRKLDKPKYDGIIVIELDIGTLERVLERNFKKLLDAYLEMRNSPQTLP